MGEERYLLRESPLGLINKVGQTQLLDPRRNRFWILVPSVFCFRSWSAICQYVILSPHSQVMDCLSEPCRFAASSMTGLLAMILLQFGQVIWFSIFFPFLAQSTDYAFIIQRTLPGRIHRSGSVRLRHLGEPGWERFPEVWPRGFSVESLPLDWPSGSTGERCLHR